jgi:hypothetical protein
MKHVVKHNHRPGCADVRHSPSFFLACRTFKLCAYINLWWPALPHCGTQLAAMWSTLYIEMSEDCNYTFSGNGGSYIMPVTFAEVSYPTRSGIRQPYIVLQDTSKEPSSSAWGSNTWRYFNITKDENDYDVYNQVTSYHNTTLEGFLASWAHTALPGFKKGTWSSASNVPGNYTIKASGPSSFKLLSKDTGCMFTYRMDTGSFAGLAPTPCNLGSSSDCPASGSCPIGKFQRTQEGPSTHFCAMCPAGTIGNGDNGCNPCELGTAAMAVGSTTCQACQAPLVPTQGSSNPTCALGCSSEDPSFLSTTSSNIIYKNGASCDVEVCPNGTVATPNNECLAAQNGELCIALSAAGNPTCKTKAEASTNMESKTEAWGGAVLKLESANMSAAVCNTGVKQLAAWLSKRQTWMGFNYTQWGAERGWPIYIDGLQWNVLGTINGSNFRNHPRCSGNALGGYGPQRSLTHGSGTVLGECRPTEQQQYVGDTALQNSVTCWFCNIPASNKNGFGICATAKFPLRQPTTS